ncbi:VanZ family protein [Bacillus mojavensis]|uniref:VanZ family protein n=1 Tax=Bacillus mojavensis TaxID=72360 RepID=UPI0039678303
MLDSTFLLIFMFVLYICFILYRIMKRFIYKKERMAIYKHLVIFCLIVYFFELISVTIFPLPIDRDLIANLRNDSYHPFLYGNNFIPFCFVVDIYHLGLQFYVIRSLGGNLILLLPVGLLFPLLFDKLRNLKRILLTGFFISLFIELTQLSISIYLGNSYRSFDVDDLILNTSGAALGYGLFCILPSLYKKIRFFHKH